MMTMTLDMTSQLAPIYWWLLAMLLALPAGFVARHLIDADILELYVGDRALLVATTAVVAATVAVLLLVDLTSVRAVVSRSSVERPPAGTPIQPEARDERLAHSRKARLRPTVNLDHRSATSGTGRKG